MKDTLAHILQQTQETYKNVYPGITSKQTGWEIWYAKWLLALSDIRELLGVTPTQQTLEKLLLRCEKEYQKTPTTESWGSFSANVMRQLVEKHVSSKKEPSNRDK